MLNILLFGIALRMTLYFLHKHSMKVLAKQPKPKPNGFMIKNDILEIIQNNVDVSCLIKIDSDFKYIYTEKNHDDFTEIDDTNFQKYISGKFDCKNFTYHYLTALYEYIPDCIAGEVGILTSTGQHRAVFFIDENKKFWIREPQSDEKFELPEDWKIYRVFIGATLINKE